jgi:CheY-like chemotaxis protein
VAHDLNNLLSPIVAYTDLLSLDLSPDDPRQADIADVKKAAARATELTRQLLAVSRKQVLSIETTDLAKTVSDFEGILRRTVREDISLEVDVPGTPCLIRADVSQLEQILLNLAVNAQDAMPRGGEMTVAVRDKGDVVLLFRDTGAGMGPEIRVRIFEPFFTTKAQGEGTGLGLATVYGIVTQHGGRIAVESEVGAGTCFRIEFPAVSPEEGRGDARAPRRSSGIPRGEETILVVEDDPAVRKLLGNVLARYGYRVLETGSAEDCLALVESGDQRFDLLLADVVLPGLNGRDLYERLATDNPDLRVLYMSGYTDDVVARHGVLEDGVDLIQKPIGVEALTNKVREVLDR